jgi:outer membrane protein assembly factor BamB
MKNKILFGWMIMITMVSMAQSSKIDVLYNEKSIGKDIKSHKAIIAQEYIFPKRIHEIYLDTISGNITLKLRKLSKNGKVLDISGEVLVFDLINKQVKWDKKVEFTTNNIYQYGNIITQNIGNKLICLNNETGEKIWDIKNDLYYVDPIKKIGVGYKYKGFAGNLHTLEGVNLISGNSIWEKELNREYGWNKTIQLNDSTILIAASGLHTVNIKNGSGWDFNLVTGQKDYKETIAKNVAGITIGILTGTYITSSGPNVVREIISNIIIDSSEIYIASKESISKINKVNGKIIWSNQLPEDLTSKSSIFIKDSLLYLINNGFAYWGDKKIDYGIPFINGLNLKTGEQIFYKTISEKKDPICDFKTYNDTLLISYKNRLTKYSLKDGSELFSKTFDQEEYGDLKFFTGNHIYLKTRENNFTQLTKLDSTKYYIQTSKRKTLILDYDFNIINQIDFDELYYNYATIDKNKLLAKDIQTIILDKNNQEIANLDLSYTSTIVGTTLYNFKGNSLFVVNLKELFKTKPNP